MGGILIYSDWKHHRGCLNENIHSTFWYYGLAKITLGCSSFPNLSLRFSCCTQVVQSYWNSPALMQQVGHGLYYISWGGVFCSLEVSSRGIMERGGSHSIPRTAHVPNKGQSLLAKDAPQLLGPSPIQRFCTDAAMPMGHLLHPAVVGDSHRGLLRVK